jgi:hypothetical protein
MTRRLPECLLSILSSILNRGIRPTHTANEKIRVRLSNELAVADGVTALFVGPLCAWLTGQWTWIPLMWLGLLPNVSPLYWNARGQYHRARVVSIVWATVFLSGLALLVGPECHLEVGLLVAAAGTLVLLGPDDPIDARSPPLPSSRRSW